MSSLRTLAIISLLLSSSLDAHSATIEILKTDGPTIVTVVGELSHGDEKVFVRKMLEAEEGIVDFDSPGGNLMAGIEIGRAIRLAGFRTGVLDGASCASACALAWLGGTRLFAGPNARIGFHAASAKDEKVRDPANALVG